MRAAVIILILLITVVQGTLDTKGKNCNVIECNECNSGDPNTCKTCNSTYINIGNGKCALSCNSGICNPDTFFPICYQWSATVGVSTYP